MGQLTLTLQQANIQKMKAYYDKYLDKAPQGAIFRARTNQAVITAYKSGKVLFQGGNVEAEPINGKQAQHHQQTRQADDKRALSKLLLIPHRLRYLPPTISAQMNQVPAIILDQLQRQLSM